MILFQPLPITTSKTAECNGQSDKLGSHFSMDGLQSFFRKHTKSAISLSYPMLLCQYMQYVLVRYDRSLARHVFSDSVLGANDESLHRWDQ